MGAWVNILKIVQEDTLCKCVGLVLPPGLVHKDTELIPTLGVVCPTRDKVNPNLGCECTHLTMDLKVVYIHS